MMKRHINKLIQRYRLKRSIKNQIDSVWEKINHIHDLENLGVDWVWCETQRETFWNRLSTLSSRLEKLNTYKL
jgi:hypothetical protein